MNQSIKRELAGLKYCLVLAEHNHMQGQSVYVTSFLEDALKSLKSLEKELKIELNANKGLVYMEREIELLLKQVAESDDLKQRLRERVYGEQSHD